VNKTIWVALSILLAFLIGSCKASSSAQNPAADSAPGTGKRWRLEKEMIAADNQQDYATGTEALRTLDAFGTMEVSQLFYHHKLVMVPAGTLVAEADSASETPQTPPGGKSSPDAKRGTKVRVLDGPESGHTLWLYPESAEKMGFPPATPTP
jgi:hypothetical protein